MQRILDPRVEVFSDLPWELRFKLQTELQFIDFKDIVDELNIRALTRLNLNDRPAPECPFDARVLYRLRRYALDQCYESRFSFKNFLTETNKHYPYHAYDSSSLGKKIARYWYNHGDFKLHRHYGYTDFGFTSYVVNVLI